MASLGRLLGLMALSVSVWFVPMSLLVCSGALSWLIPISQGVPRLCVLLMILLLPPLFFSFACLGRTAEKPSSVSNHPTVVSRQVSSFGDITDEKHGQLGD